MTDTFPAWVHTVDCHYIFENRAAAYLVHDSGEAAFIDNGTRFSVPSLLQALAGAGMRPEQVKHIIVTHIHLDHSGGTAELAKACPNAGIIAHPRAGRHIADPSRLVAGARSIYGADRFEELYGEIEPVDESRVRTVEDGGTVTLGQRTFTILHSPGHARHHFVVYDAADGILFSGDAFGLAYQALQSGSWPYFNYVSAPPDFDPPAAAETVERIAALAPRWICVTHYGPTREVSAGREQLLHNLAQLDKAADELNDENVRDEALDAAAEEKVLAVIADNLRECGLDPSDKTVMKWAASELLVSTKGISTLARQRRAGAASEA